MALADISRPESVMKAVAEYRRSGREAFLKKYGYGLARDYFLVIDGERFDSKAIVGVAHGYEFPDEGPLRFDQFTGGARSVVPKLEQLGFIVERGNPGPGVLYFSNSLIVGQVYTRETLKEMLKTEDRTLYTGIFHPDGYPSILLFITKNKTPDRVQYENRLEGDALYFQSQMEGRKDRMLARHREDELELLVFYRDSKNEYSGAGFRYEGQFEYVSNDGSRPSNFELRRVSTPLTRIAIAEESAGAFNPADIDDARTKTLASIVRRQGQPAFRLALIRAYEGRCAISECATAEVLEAAHIISYKGPATNHVSNGILLRADLHTLFDLKLLAIDEQTHTVIVAESLHRSEYGLLHGQSIRLPMAPGDRPSAEALRAHRNSTGMDRE